MGFSGDKETHEAAGGRNRGRRVRIFPRGRRKKRRKGADVPLPPAADTHDRRALVLTLSCDDRPRIVAAVTAELSPRAALSQDQTSSGIASQQVLPAHRLPADRRHDAGQVRIALQPTVERFGIRSRLVPGRRKPNHHHGLEVRPCDAAHLLYQIGSAGSMPIVAIVSRTMRIRAAPPTMRVCLSLLAVNRENGTNGRRSCCSSSGYRGRTRGAGALRAQVLSDRLSSRLFDA